MLDALLSWDGWTVTQLPAEQAAIFRLEGVPPSEEFLFIQESEALEILFCRKSAALNIQGSFQAREMDSPRSECMARRVDHAVFASIRTRVP